MSLAHPSQRATTPHGLRFAAVGALLLVAASLLHPVAASAAPVAAASATTVNYTVTRTPSADAFTASALPRRHYGQRTYLRAGTSGHDTLRSYLHFSLPSTGRLISAKLTLTRAGHWSGGTLDAAATMKRWSERTLDRRNSPHVRWSGRTHVDGHSRTVTINVTSAFRAHRSTTLALQMVGHRSIQFASRQARSGKPVLRVVMSTKVTRTTPTPITDPTPVSGGSGCAVSAKLVPSCGRWWGIAPEQFQNVPLSTSLPTEDQIAQRRTDIVHVYHVNSQLFPTAAEKAEALAPGYQKLLLINWKPATDMSWAAVAQGGADARIDREAEYIDQNFPYRFFLTIYHEPEDNVRTAAGSGYTPTDYAAMYRHVVLRLRADGVDNAVTVMNYMGFDKWGQQSWFNELWPGNDVVDWIGLDTYGSGTPGGWGGTDFKTMVNSPVTGFPGYYTWATKEHPGKPIMLCEWGVVYDASHPTGQSMLLDSMKTQLADFPQIRSLVYYDVAEPPAGYSTHTTVTLNAVAEASYRRMASSLDSPQPSVVYAS